MPTANTIDSAYLTAANKAIFSFQMIEEALKVCIGLSHEAIRKAAPAPVVFKVNPKKINNAPLGQLIELFSQVSSNTDLISDLRKVTKWRNFCAHNAFAHEFLTRTSKSNFTPHKVEDVETVVQFCANLVERLGNEMKSIRTAHKTLVGKSHAESSSAGT